jgi:hypothetical protein
MQRKERKKMKRKDRKSSLVVFAFAAVLCMVSSARAQDPMLQRGVKELALSGVLDFEQAGDPLLDLNGRYGYFLQNLFEIGGFAEIAGNFDDVFRYGVGGFAELHFPPLMASAVPYVGADLGFSFVDTDLGEDNAALIFRPRAGLKWFVREYFAIDTSFFVALATDDIFQNDRNDLDPYDIGLRLGLRLYFR